MTAGLAVAAATRLPLAWDGAWFFLRAADTGTPTFLFRRAIHAVLQAPALLTAAVSGDVFASSLAFSAAYVAVPLVGLLAAWWVVRDERPGLIAWPILGIALVELPGRMFFVSESAMVAELAWALVFAAALGRMTRHRILVVVLAVAIALAHPFGGPALVGIGVVAWIARRRGASADPAWIARTFVLVGVALAAITVGLRSPYEMEATSLGELAAKFRASIVDGAMAAPLAALLIGLAAFVRMRPRVRMAAVLGVLALTLALLLPWALDPAGWGGALRYRAWFVVLVAPLVALAVIDALRPAPWMDRRAVLVGAPIVMAVTLAALGVSWMGLQARLVDTLAASPTACVERPALEWVDGTPLDHWSITSLGLVLEGHDPAHASVLDRPCAGVVGPGGIVVKETPFDRDVRPVDGWWRFDRLVGSWAPTSSTAP